MSHKEKLKQELRRQLADGKSDVDIIVERCLGLLVEVKEGELSTSEALAILNLIQEALKEITLENGR